MSSQAAANSPKEILSFKISNFNRVAAVAGGFLSVFGLVSFLLKEKFYLGEALVSTIAGVIFSPHATNLIRPLEYASGSQRNLDSVTLYFSRMVLGIQLVIAGIQLPSRYLWKERKSLSLLLGPGMCAMWISTALLVWALVPDIPFVFALAVGSCVTPTDPVLSNSIVKGKFADKNIPKELQNVIIAESGANDGLGYPFLFIALYLIRYTYDGGLGQTGGAGKAMGYWFGITWGYTIIMSTLYGAVVGVIFKDLLRWAEKRKFVDRESFLVFAVSLALFIVGTLGMIGSDDVLACFVAGNVFTWDDWFRVETQDDSFQPTIDMLLNVAIFIWYGAVCPWHAFLDNSVIPIYRLIFLGILVLLLRRIPMVYAMHKHIHQIYDLRQTLFVGYFGPIGVSAIFYLYTSLEYLATIQYNGHEREDAKRLGEIMHVVVWFMVICSIIGHGLSIPLGKLGVWLPRTMSRALSERSWSRQGGASSGNRSDPILPFRIQSAVTPKISEPLSNGDEEQQQADDQQDSTSDPASNSTNQHTDAAEATSTAGASPATAAPAADGDPVQNTSTNTNTSSASPVTTARPLFKIGGTSIPTYRGNPDVDAANADDDEEDEEDDPSAAAKGEDTPAEVRLRHQLRRQRHEQQQQGLAPPSPAGAVGGDASPGLPGTPARSIRFESSPERERVRGVGRGKTGKGTSTW